MGAADVIPGISGGTIAFIMGFFENLIKSIRSFDREALYYLLRGRLSAFLTHINALFLIPLLLGIATSFITAAQLVEKILSNPNQRVLLYSTFLGLMIASIILCFQRIKEWKWVGVFALLTGAYVAFWLTDPTLMNTWKPTTFEVIPNQSFFDKLPEVSPELINLKDDHLLSITASQMSGMVSKGFINREDSVIEEQTHSTVPVRDLISSSNILIEPWLILSGMMAISAMLLPGISGSYLLNVFGVYPIAIGAVVDFTNSLAKFSLDLDAGIILGNLLIGIVIGAIVFSHVVDYLLEHYHATTLAALVGFMVGALRAVWPFWTVYFSVDPIKPEKGARLEILEPYIPSLNSPLAIESIFLVVFGISIVFGLHKMASHKEKKAL